MRRKIVSVCLLAVLLCNMFGCQIIGDVAPPPQQNVEYTATVWEEDNQTEYQSVESAEDETKPTTTETVENDEELAVSQGPELSVEVDADGKITITLPDAESWQNTANGQGNNTPSIEDEYLVQSDVPAMVVSDETNEYGYNYMYGTEFYGHELYEFDDTLTRGSVSLYNLSSASVSTLDYEAYYGVTAYTDGFDLYVKAYNHSSDHPIISSTIISDMGDIEDININYDDYTVIDCKELDYGLYNIVVEFDTNTVDMYIFVAENGVFTCRNTVHQPNYTLCDYFNRQDTIATKLDEFNITPENCLSNDEIMYPCIESPGHRCDTERWAQLSHDLILEGTEWSDEFITFVYTEWFINNIKYDDWRYNNGASRALEWGVWDGTYSMWDLKVGVCCDFTNAMIIMLREQGIPATSLESHNHMWLLVYLDGEWREIDITTIMPYHTNTIDASNCVNRMNNYNDYGNIKSEPIISIGADVWTYDRIINGTNY